MKEIELCSKQPVIWLILQRDSTAKKKKKVGTCELWQFSLSSFPHTQPKDDYWSPTPTYKHNSAYPALFQTTEHLSFCLLWGLLVWSGLFAWFLYSRAMLTGLISIYPDKLPFGVSQALNKCGGGHESTSVPGMRSELSHTEGKAWTSLSRLKHRAGLIAR